MIWKIKVGHTFDRRRKKNLNPELVKGQQGSIEYVIIPNLRHLVHHNHTKPFCHLPEHMMPALEGAEGKPDWKS